MTIDPEFRALIPPLQADERAQLEVNLAAEGCREPLVLWRGILIDGHNRHEICTSLGIKYKTTEITLASRQHALLWIETNQLGRRNLTDDQRGAIGHSVKERRVALEKKERASKAGKTGGVGRRKNSLPDTAVGKLSKDRSKESRKSIAKAARVSERKLRTIAAIAAKKPQALLEIRSGAKTVQQVQSEIKRAERIEKVATLAAPPPLSTIARRYPVIYADPPWQYEYTETEARAIENQYPTMELAAICALDVASAATDDALLFLWATSPKLVDALAVIKAWGFEYRTNLVWIKDKLGMGYYVRAQHELLLIAKRGTLPTPEAARRPSSVLAAPRGAHSEKPAEIYDLIERMYPELPRLELFARSAPREGWAQWGNETQ